MSDSDPLPRVLKPEQKTSFGGLLLKSFLIFLGLGLLAVFISWSFGWIAVEKYSVTDLFQKIVSGRSEVKRMAAAEWARELIEVQEKGEVKGQLGPDSNQSKSLLAELEMQKSNPQGFDAPLAGGIATILGFSQDQPLAIKGLEDFLESYDLSSSIEPYIYSIVSLARLNSYASKSLELFLKASQHSDFALRKAAAFALGNPLHPESPIHPSAQARLRELLEDSVEDVRTNAAIALAQRGDLSAKPVLEQIVGEIENGKDPSLEQFQRDVEVFRAMGKLKDRALLDRLKVISMTHPNLKLRQAAKVEVSK